MCYNQREETDGKQSAVIFDIFIAVFLMIAALYGLWQGLARTLLLLLLLCIAVYATILPHALPSDNPLAALTTIETWLLFLVALMASWGVCLFLAGRFRPLFRGAAERRGLRYELHNFASIAAGAVLGLLALILSWFAVQSYSPSLARAEHLNSSRVYGYFVSRVVLPTHEVLLASLPEGTRLPSLWSLPRQSEKGIELRLDSGKKIVLPLREDGTLATEIQTPGENEASVNSDESPGEILGDDVYGRALRDSYESAEGENEIDKALDQFINIRTRGVKAVSPGVRLDAPDEPEVGEVDVGRYQRSVGDALDKLRGDSASGPGSTERYEESVQDALKTLDAIDGGGSP